MNAQDLIRTLIEESPVWSQNRLAASLGYSAANFSKRLHAQKVDAAFVAEVLGALGYDLVAVPSQTRLPNGARVIGGEAE